jgi:nicotinamide mononucleotide transporter
LIEPIVDFFLEAHTSDVIAVISGIIYVVLASKNHVSCWFFGIISALMTMYSVWFYMNLYLETLLNAYYVFAGIWGWYHWSKTDKDTNRVKVKPFEFHLKIIVFGLLMALLLGWIFDQFSNASSTYLDALTTIFALIATTLTAQRVLENWFYWIFTDLISIYLYHSRGGSFFVILFTAYICFSMIGYFKWKKELNAKG